MKADREKQIQDFTHMQNLNKETQEKQTHRCREPIGTHQRGKRLRGGGKGSTAWWQMVMTLGGDHLAEYTDVELNIVHLRHIMLYTSFPLNEKNVATLEIY